MFVVYCVYVQRQSPELREFDASYVDPSNQFNVFLLVWADREFTTTLELLEAWCGAQYGYDFGRHRGFDLIYVQFEFQESEASKNSLRYHGTTDFEGRQIGEGHSFQWFPQFLGLGNIQAIKE